MKHCIPIGKILSMDMLQRDKNFQNLKDDDNGSRVDVLYGKYLPLSFFDLQVQLIWHLVEEVELYGPISHRWMYF